MIIEFKNGMWHEVHNSLATRWLMTGKARKTRRVKIARGDYLQYIELTGRRGWRWALGEIDEHRFAMDRLAKLGRP